MKSVSFTSRCAYRQLMRAADCAALEGQLYNRDGLRHYISHRFRQVSRRNRLNRVAKSQIETQLQSLRSMTTSLAAAPTDASLMSMLQVLSSGVGNHTYKRDIEGGFLRTLSFHEQQKERKEFDEESTSERQVRIMQQASLSYAEKLSLLHREDLAAASHLLLHTFQTLCRSDSSVHHINHGADQLVIEIDDELNKQIIYVKCADYDWRQPVERLEICEPEMLRKTMFHAEYYSIALRLVEALAAETQLHRSRGTVLVGHGVAGAVATCMAMLLHSQNYDVKNVVTLGAPKVTQRTLERVVEAISPIRFVISGDALVELPVSGSEGELFRHYGEIICFNVPTTSKKPDDNGDTKGTAADGVSSETGEVDSSAAELMMNDMMTGDGEARDGSLASTADDTPAPPSSVGMIFDSEDPLRASDAEEHQTDEEVKDASFANVKAEAAARARDPYLFSVVHYVELMRDQSVPITYAEGDEVWDGGEFDTKLEEEYARAGQRRVLASQEHRESLKSPN